MAVTRIRTKRQQFINALHLEPNNATVKRRGTPRRHRSSRAVFNDHLRIDGDSERATRTQVRRSVVRDLYRHLVGHGSLIRCRRPSKPARGRINHCTGWGRGQPVRQRIAVWIGSVCRQRHQRTYIDSLIHNRGECGWGVASDGDCDRWIAPWRFRPANQERAIPHVSSRSKLIGPTRKRALLNGR